MKKTAMKTTRNLLLAGMMTAFCCSIGSAQIIYSNAFNGGAVDINGTAPTYINPSAASLGGSSSAAWDVVTNDSAAGYAAYQDGTLGSKLNSVLLPFTPVSGYVYTLSSVLTYPVAPTTGGWGGLGFAAHLPASNSGVLDPRMGSSYIGGNPWALLNMNANGGGAILNANGGNQGQVPNLMTALNTPYNITITLDTTAANWSTALYIDSTLVGSYTWTSGNPNLTSFGYTQTTTTAGAFKWSSMVLSAAPVPEPSALALISAGFGMMLVVILYRRRRYTAEKTVTQ